VIYTRLAVTPSDPARREAVSAALFAGGAEGILEEGAALVSVFTDARVARSAERAARNADSKAIIVVAPYDPGDWMNAWRQGVGPREVGRFVIAPPWRADELTGRDVIVIDPGMGFGTGEHETTRMSLSLLQGVVADGDVVADVGCGSAVLAIAAAKLGAARVAAIEIDPLAIVNAEENIERNGVGDRVTVVEGDATSLLPLLAPLRVVVANIIAPVLLELLPVVQRAIVPHGDVIVGGILASERDGFVRAVELDGWRLVNEQCEGDWWGGHLRQKTA
jgi:ribosomal protein L11 methyltransferase